MVAIAALLALQLVFLSRLDRLELGSVGEKTPQKSARAGRVRGQCRTTQQVSGESCQELSVDNSGESGRP